MKHCIYNTDPNWLASLAKNGVTDNVNFWRKDKRKLNLLEGASLFFKKRGTQEIVGRGIFREMKMSTLQQAWEEFGKGNGADTFEEFTERAAEVIHIDSEDVCCIILDRLEFLSDEDTYTVPESFFAKNILASKFVEEQEQPKLFELFEPFTHVSDKKHEKLISIEKGISEEEFSTKNLKEGKERVLRSLAIRRGQKGFRDKLLRAYSSRCAVTGTSVADVLEAAHIIPYSGKETNHTQNGILLRADIHTLFDLGLAFIADDYSFHLVTESLRREYPGLNGKRINLPELEEHHPSLDALAHHRKENGI